MGADMLCSTVLSVLGPLAGAAALLAPLLILCHRHLPTVVDALWALPVVQLAAGDAHSAALTSSGHMFIWGSNHFGQLGLVRDGDPLSMRVHRK
jgi:hypothetical protein